MLTTGYDENGNAWADGTKLYAYAAPQASAEDVRNAALEEAAAAVEDHQRVGRGWVPGSLWDTLSREAAARVRALKQTQAQKEQGHG